MIISSIDTLKQHITNALGWKTSRKIVIIESDDWGAIRMPSRRVYDILEKEGLDIDDSYNRYDSLATEQDLVAMFELLASFQDRQGNHPALTANSLVANPDFARIREAGYREYFFEPFTRTLERYPGCEGSFALWQQGMAQGLFHPQFHGREHLNVPAWLAALQAGDRDARIGCEHGCWGHTIRDKDSRRMSSLAAYDFNTSDDLHYVCAAAAEGMELFAKIFGYASRSFIAPNFVWPPEIEKILHERGARLIQSQRNQLIPVAGEGGYQTKFHYTGQKNSLGQRYLVRNAYFEPSSDPGQDWVGTCLQDISRAFFWKTPAILSAHRVNFIGAIVEENRTRNLVLLKELLGKILLRWPEVEFLTSDQLFYHELC